MDSNNISRVIKTSQPLPSQPLPLPTLQSQYAANFKKHNHSPQNLNLNNYNPHSSLPTNKMGFPQHTPLTTSQLDFDNSHSHSPSSSKMGFHNPNALPRQLPPQPHTLSSQNEFIRSSPFAQFPQQSLPFNTFQGSPHIQTIPSPPPNYQIISQITQPTNSNTSNNLVNPTPLFSSNTNSNSTLSSLIPTIMDIIQKKITSDSPQNPVVTLDGKATPHNFDKKLQNMKKAVQKYSTQLHNAASNQSSDEYIELFEKFTKETNNGLETSGKQQPNGVTKKGIHEKSTNEDSERTLHVYVTHTKIPSDILKETATEILDLITDQYKTDLDQSTKFSLQNFERQSADLKQILDLNEKKLAEMKSYYEQRISEMEKSSQLKSDELRDDLMKENELLKQKIKLLEQKISDFESESDLSSRSISYDELVEKLAVMEDELEKSRKREEVLLKNKSKTEKEYSKKVQELEGLNIALRNLIKKAP
eukprot:TRINITY_DN493_c0_g1_i1.p1 TRINITY_DN493_c0_g1~~TRINITY_DN493_c0_g1_i1.p1  ORF type:complete len:476 (-),score=112.62 TRINITY_DN493_c0_g1_i1:96-1523(-)